MTKNEDDEIFVSLTSSGRSAGKNHLFFHWSILLILASHWSTETLGVTSLLGLYKVAGTHNQVFKNKHCKVLVSCSEERFKKTQKYSTKLQRLSGTFRNLQELSETFRSLPEPPGTFRNLRMSD